MYDPYQQDQSNIAQQYQRADQLQTRNPPGALQSSGQQLGQLQPVPAGSPAAAAQQISASAQQGLNAQQQAQYAASRPAGQMQQAHRDAFSSNAPPAAAPSYRGWGLRAGAQKPAQPPGQMQMRSGPAGSGFGAQLGQMRAYQTPQEQARSAMGLSADQEDLRFGGGAAPAAASAGVMPWAAAIGGALAKSQQEQALRNQASAGVRSQFAGRMGSVPQYRLQAANQNRKIEDAMGGGGLGSLFGRRY